MRDMGSRFGNFMYFLYRWISPLVDPIRLMRGIVGYFWYWHDLYRYKKMKDSEKILLMNTYPVLNERVPTTPIDSHYFYQDNWAVKQIYQNGNIYHVDVGSNIYTVGHIAGFTHVTFVDIRPLQAKWDNLECVSGDILNLPFVDNSVQSLSCLHVAEHVGLGRYGDRLDPEGTKKAARELIRVLARGGNLYFSLPVGRSRLCFNSHRIHSPRTIIDYFNGLELIESSGVTDSVGKRTGLFVRNVPIDILENSHYACGLFWFRKPTEEQEVDS